MAFYDCVQTLIFMENMIKTHHLEYVFYSGSKITNSKSVARCVAIIDIYIINNGTFYRLNPGTPSGTYIYMSHVLFLHLLH